MALFDLDGLKEYLNITVDTEDVQLELLVGAVDGLIKKYLMRDIESTEYTAELYDGTGTNALVLNQYPIVEVDTVLSRGTEVVAVSVLEREDCDIGYYIKDAETGILWNNTLWDRGRGIIEVTYTAGYEDVPSDLLYACYETCRYFRNVGKKAGIIAESLGRYHYTLAAGLSDMGGDLTIPVVAVKNILDRYRRPDISGAY
jgi:hypothetical protein